MTTLSPADETATPAHGLVASQHTATRLLFGTRRIAAGILIIELIFAVAAAPWDYRSLTVAWVLLAAAVLALIYVVIKPVPTTLVMVICGTIAVIQLANLVPVGGVVEVAVLIGWLRLGGWMISLSFGLRRAVVVLAIVAASGCGVLLLSGGVSGAFATSWYSTIVVCAAGFASAVGLASACAALDRAAQSEDAAAREQLDIQRARASAAARRQETSRIGWSLHDTVVNTLHVIATGIPADQVALVRGRCARDLAAIDEWRRQPGLSDNAIVEASEIGVALQREASTLGVQLTVEFQEGVCDVPRDVLDAAVGALRESLVNVAKHAPRSSVGLQIELHPDAFSIAIDDDGPGFTPAAADTRGISSSIIARCEQRGIAASVDSRPGEGTTVTLKWRRRSNEQPGDEVALPEPQAARLQPGMRSAIGAALTWVLLLCLAPVLLSMSWSEFALQTAAWLFLALAAAGCVRALRSAHVVNTRWLVALGASTMFASFAYSTGEATNGLDVWAYAPGLLGIAVAGATAQRVRWILAVWFCGALGVVVGAGGDFVEQVAAHPAESLAVLNIIPLVAVAWVLHRFAGGVRAAQDFHETATSLVVADHLAAQQAARNERLAFADTLTSPFMRSIADGKADPVDPACRARALELERLARTIATIPSLGPRSERLMMDLAVYAFETNRRVRIGVVATTDKDLPAEVEQGVEDVLRRAVAAVPPGGYITVSARSTGGTVELTLVCDSDADLGELVGSAHGLAVAIDAEPDQSVAFVTWELPQPDQMRSSIHVTT